MRRLLLCLLALVVGASVPAAGAAAKSGDGGKHPAKTTHAKKKKRNAASTSARGQKGPKGEKGDKGDPGAKGDAGAKGDPGSAVVARARLASPTSTGDSGDTTVPLNGASWTAAPDEADDWAGSVTFTLPSACDGQTDLISTILDGGEQPGSAEVNVKVDDESIGSAFVDYDPAKAGQAVTVPIDFWSG